MIMNMTGGGGGTPKITLRETVTLATRTNAATMSVSGLDVRSGETLVGLWVVYRGTGSTAKLDVNSLQILQSGERWLMFYASADSDGTNRVMMSGLLTFEKNGETAGTITLQNYMNFIEGEYNVFPIVASLS